MALRELSRHPRGVRLDELAQRLALPKSSSHRTLAALRRSGFVEQDEHRRYRLSLELVRLALTFYESLDEQALVQPVLESLAALTGEAAHYAVLDGGEIVYVARVAPSQFVFRMAATVGGRQPAYSTALGRALLAYKLHNEQAAARFLAEHPTTATIAGRKPPTPDALARELERTRERGYAVDDQENEPGVNCVAFPIFLGSGSIPSGAISISAIAQRTPLEMLANRAEQIRLDIEDRLGPVTAPEPRPVSAAGA